MSTELPNISVREARHITELLNAGAAQQVERDKLARILDEWLDDEAPLNLRRYVPVADAILAAGYRKPQQVTTVEELDALPAGSILLSHSEYRRYAGTVWRVSSERMIEKVGREVEGVTPSRYFKDPLPATLLHVGGAEA